MTPEMKNRLRQLLINDEDYRRFPYVDSTGNITIGVGYNLSDRGMPDSWINNQLNEDIDYHYKQLNIDFPWFKDLSEARQIVLVNMSFNLGSKGFSSFKRMIAALSIHDYKKAAKEMLDSRWAKQVNVRAPELADIMIKGEMS